MERAISSRVRFGLSTKIFLATAAVVIVVLGGALLVTARRANQAADESIDKALAATRSAIEDALQRRSGTLVHASAVLARVPQYVARISEGLRTDNRSTLLDQADEFRQQIGADWTLLTDNVGILKARSNRRDAFGDDLSEGSLVGLALAGDSTQGIWIEPGPAGDVLYQAVGVPIMAPGAPRGSAPYGVLVAAVPIDSAFVAEIKRNTNSDVVIVSLDTTNSPHVAASTLSLGSVGSAMAQAPDMETSLAGLKPGEHVRWKLEGETLAGIVGPLVTASGTPVGGYVGFRSRSRELAVFTRLRDTIAIAFVGGIVLALLSSVVIARQITRPVQQLVEATRQVGEGQYSADIQVRSRDEIGQLAASFQSMVQELKDKQSLIEYMSGPGAKTVTLSADQLSAVTLPQALVGRGPSTTQAASMLAAGSVLDGRYEIKKVLGVGGMGVVYRAHDRELDEPVAIKTLKPDSVQTDGTSLERFKQEIRLARRITHRNVVRTHDLGEVNGMYYITMEFVEGTSLKDLIKKRGHLPAGVAITVGKQLCRALEVAHEQGVIHRDIKPQNMVVDAGGFLKVMDFGIARLAESKQQDAKGLTAAGVAIGTPEYMPPEQLMGEELDSRADLYSAGAVLYECVTGQPVFSAPTVTALMVKHLEAQPQDPREIVSDIPGPLAAVILKALAKGRDARWQTAAEMSEALDAVRVEAAA
ncbi:MAG: protein kinase [Gemmatimonadetes bacterium]|nr:protein kinase [Gemmatimonadota bacterium]